MAATYTFVVPDNAAGDRLDRFLVRQMPDWSRSQIHRLIRDGLVMLGAATAKKGGEDHRPEPASASAPNTRSCMPRRKTCRSRLFTKMRTCWW